MSECTTATDVFGYIGIAIMFLLAGATLLGLISWADPTGTRS